jgi:hypothetical protein
MQLDLDGVYSLLADKTRTTPWRKRDSSLAWRTIRWVCSIDEAACDVVKTQVLNPRNLIAAEAIGMPPTMMSERRGLAFTKPSSTCDIWTSIDDG